MIRALTIAVPISLALVGGVACTPEQRAKNAERELAKDVNDGIEERQKLAEKQEKEAFELRQRQAEERADTRIDTAEEVADDVKDLNDAYAKMSKQQKDDHMKVQGRFDGYRRDLTGIERDYDSTGVTDDARAAYDRALADAQRGLDEAKAKADGLANSTEAGWEKAKADASAALDQAEAKINELRAKITKRSAPGTPSTTGKKTSTNPRDDDPTPRDINDPLYPR